MRFPPLPPVTKNLLIINVIIWAAINLFPQLGASVIRLASLHYFSSPAFNVTQLFTYMFIQESFAHLFFNMFALWMFGAIIERSMGPARFLFYYISCGLFAALVQMGVYAIMIHNYIPMLPPGISYDDVCTEGWLYMQQGYNFLHPAAATINQLVNGSMIGASGAIFGVILAFGMLFPNQPIYLFFIPVPIKAKYLVIGYGVLELVMGLGNMVDNVAHFAHLGGMIAGVLLILYWKKKGVFNNHWFF